MALLLLALSARVTMLKQRRSVLPAMAFICAFVSVPL
jgi:hypothetical protein